MWRIGLFLALCATTAHGQVPFLRGDLNDDGRVSIADAHVLSLWKRGGGPPPACIKTADANDDGTIIVNGFSQYYDYLPIFYHAICCETDCGRRCEEQALLAEPLESPGEDSTPDDLPCEQYTGAAPPVTDPEARIEILDATCSGGMDALAVVKVRISHSRTIGGYSGAFDAAALFEKALASVDVAGAWAINGSPRYAELNADGLVHFGYLDSQSLGGGWPDRLEIGFMPPVQEQVALKLYLRLEPGTRAGTYPIAFLEGEMADGATGQAIFPALADGLLTIEEDVAADAIPERNARTDFCPGYETLPPTGPEDMQVAHRMGLVAGERGSLVTVPLWIHANAPIEAFSFAFSYRRDAVRLVRVLSRDDGRPWEAFRYDATHRSAPEQPLDDVWGEAVFSAADPAGLLPPRVLHHVLDIELEVLPTAPDGLVQMQLTSFSLDPALPDRVVWRTDFKALGQWLWPHRITCTDGTRFDESGILIGDTTTPFLRGDANQDGVVSFADAILIGHGTQPQGPRIRCLDAADANDDGSANYGDAVRLFQHLVEPPSTATEVPAPFPEAGADGTVDRLLCDDYRVAPAASSEDAIVRVGSVAAAPGESVQVPILMSPSRPLQGYQLIVRHDPAAFTPTGARVRLEGTAFEGAAEGFSLNHVASSLLPGHLALVFTSNAIAPSTVSAGQDILVGRLDGVVSSNLQPGDEVILEPVAFAADVPPRPDRWRTELIVIEEGRPVPRLPVLEAGRVSIVDPGEPTFLRGDANADLTVNISDPIFTLAYLFLGGAAPACEDAADADDSGKLELTDAVFTLSFLFGGVGARPLPPPYPERGRDAETDGLSPCQ